MSENPIQFLRKLAVGTPILLEYRSTQNGGYPLMGRLHRKPGSPELYLENPAHEDAGGIKHIVASKVMDVVELSESSPAADLEEMGIFEVDRRCRVKHLGSWRGGKILEVKKSRVLVEFYSEKETLQRWKHALEVAPLMSKPLDAIKEARYGR